MPTYVVINRPPADYQPNPDAATMWTDWFAELGGHLVDRGNPVFKRQTVGNVDADSVLGGYTLINADDLGTAVELAQTCPAVRQGGGAEVGELTILNAGRSTA